MSAPTMIQDRKILSHRSEEKASQLLLEGQEELGGDSTAGGGDVGTKGSRGKLAFLVFLDIFIYVSLFLSVFLFLCFGVGSLCLSAGNLIFQKKLFLCSVSHWGVPSRIHEASQGPLGASGTQILSLVKTPVGPPLSHP